MDQKALFLKFWEKEAAATRKVIARIPEERSDYRADPKARTARELAWLIVREEIALAEGLEKRAFEWVEAPLPATVKEVLDTYDRHHEDVTKRLYGLDPDRWEAQVPFIHEGKEVMSASGYDSAWVNNRGEVIVSNEAGFDPAVTFKEDWHPLTPQR